MIKFPEKLTNILSKINARGYEAYFVGGCVRDAILGIETFDIDINTNASTDVLSEIFIDYSPMVYENYGNLNFKYGEYTVDITRFRKEGKYKKHRYPSSINFKATLKDDILRRDFTINGLVYHPDRGIGDLVEGLDGLKKREMKTIGNAYLKLNEDYLRMLRLVRFAAKLNFSIEAHTMQVTKEHYYRVAEIGLSQLESDFIGFIDAEHFSKFAIENPWSVTSVISELEKAVGFDQNNVFHQHDLFEHTMNVINNVEGVELKIAALFHDIGKIKTKVENSDGTFSFPNHSTESLKIMNSYFSEWNLQGINKDLIRKLVLLHDISIPLDYVEMKKLVHYNGMDFMRKLVQFKRADNMAKNHNAAYQIEKCATYEMFLKRIEDEKPAISIKDLAISGDELQIEPALRKKILDALITRVIENKIPNDKSALLTEAQRIKDGLH